MRDTLPLLDQIAFPAIRRGRLDTLQVNVGYRCNQSCFHCHVNAGPDRTEEMTGDVADTVLDFVKRRRIATLDITGGAPELNPHFRRLVTRRAPARRPSDGPLQSHHSGAARPGRPRRISRGQPRRNGRLDAVLSGRQCRTSARQGRVRRLDPRLAQAQRARLRARSQRWCSIWSTTRKGPSLPPAQGALEADYKRVLGEQYGIVFNRLYVLANMPIQRFGSTLINKGEFDGYLGLLQDAHLDANLDGVMCRNLISVDWRGYRLRLRLQPDARSAAGAWREQARASVRSARRRYRRQSDPRRRPLLRLHRRTRLELRRRVEGGGGMSGASLSIIMPVLDEAAGIEAALQALAPLSPARRRDRRGRRRQPGRHARPRPSPRRPGAHRARAAAPCR